MPDNTKVAVIKASLYDPQINRTYAEMAAHYGTAVLPARPRKPRDKAKVEQAVLIIERWLLGRLRHRVFYGLAEVNAAIGELLTRLNEERPIRRLGVTRRRLLEEVDRPALKPLPASPTCSRSGVSGASTSTTTSRWRSITTAFRIASLVPRSRCGSPPALSRSSTRASGLPRISA
ncbi:hypothetical protein J2R78_001575 [Bradyrhizobium sp. USDA 4538]|nr:hypothetical protein [Bradyrhizobium sp. USDA 4538]MCP1899173.1 hypothetical protein [Bradyrhizobium sp. USDA 4537]MCP1986715.1 hypothetical protein [Bradyrhizobium sp. USDA 4539]